MVPRSFGGSDDGSNLVLLPVRIHIHCHELLYMRWKQEDERNGSGETARRRAKMAFALFRLQNGTPRQTGAKINFSSKIYAAAKKDSWKQLKRLKWATDGVQSKMLDKDTVLPPGWRWEFRYKGPRRSDYIWITDGKEDRRNPKTDPIPDGWTRGRAGGREAKNTIWANDGVSERWVPESELANMPGWVRGQISHRGFDNYRMRTYRTIEFEGRLVTQTELAQLLKTTQKRVSKLLKSGLAANEMAAVIAADRAKKHPLIPFQGGMFRISELERMTGVSRGAIRKGLSKGLTADEVIAMCKAKRPAADAS